MANDIIKRPSNPWWKCFKNYATLLSYTKCCSNGYFVVQFGVYFETDYWLDFKYTDQSLQEFQLTKFFLFLNSRHNADQFASPQAVFLEWIRIELKCTCHIIQSFRIHRTISIEFIENIIEILELAKQQFTISSLRSIRVEKLDTTRLVTEFHPECQWSYSSWPIRDLGPE